MVTARICLATVTTSCLLLLLRDEAVDPRRLAQFPSGVFIIVIRGPVWVLSESDSNGPVIGKMGLFMGACYLLFLFTFSYLPSGFIQIALFSVNTT